jgi:hypothetical protein
VRVSWYGWRKETDGPERLGGQAQPGIVTAEVVVETRICVVEEQ